MTSRVSHHYICKILFLLVIKYFRVESNYTHTFKQNLTFDEVNFDNLIEIHLSIQSNKT